MLNSEKAVFAMNDVDDNHLGVLLFQPVSKNESLPLHWLQR